MDSNIFVSGWIWGGTPDQVLKLGESDLITVCASEALLNEVRLTFNKDKFCLRLQTLGVTVNDLIAGLQEFLQVYPILDINLPDLRDPNDNMIIATAIAANAEVIVTGDRDLLVLQEYRGIPILTAREFLERYFPDR